MDGRLLAPHEATVSALDVGFLLGDGLFESLRAQDGAAYLLHRHLARLDAAGCELEFAHMPSPEALAEQVHETLDRAALGDAYLRITVTRGQSAAALAPPSGGPTVVIAALPAPPQGDAAAGMEAILIGPPAECGPKAKSTSRQPAVLARRKAMRAGADEAIYVSKRGRVLEGTSSNVFAVRDGHLITPPAEDCLPGITRGRLIELVREDDGLEVREAPLTVEELLGADEAFVTNAVQGLRAIRSIGGHPIGVGAKGRVFAHKGGGVRAQGGVSAHKGGVFARLLALYAADRLACGTGDRTRTRENAR